ncbi:MAG: hypothetical protein V9F04_01675 [Dermatophilaceae bacterium]
MSRPPIPRAIGCSVARARRARTRRAGAAAGASVALVLSLSGIAHAEGRTAEAQTRAISSWGSASSIDDRIAALEGEYARATSELATLQRAVSLHAREYAAAAEAERVATHAAARAQEAADRAAQAAGDARDSLSRFAAAAYEQGGVGHQGLLHLLTAGPGQALDMAQYLDDAAEAQDRQVREAESLAGLAEALSVTAVEQARVRAERARAAADAHQALDAQIAAVTDRVGQIGARQQALILELALVRQVTAEEQQRQLDARAQEAAARAQGTSPAALAPALAQAPPRDHHAQASCSRDTTDTGPRRPGQPPRRPLRHQPQPRLPRRRRSPPWRGCRQILERSRNRSCRPSGLGRTSGPA